MKALILFLLVSCGTPPSFSVRNAHTSKDVTALRWRESRFPITIEFNSNDFDSIEKRQAAINAVNTWNEASGIELIKINFSDLSLKEDFLDLDKYLKDNQITTLFPNIWPHENAPDAIAVTSYIYDSTGELLHADVLFNSNFDVDTTGSLCCMDIETVLVHELGHFLGLRHIRYEDDPYSVMNPAISSGELKRDLSRADIYILKTLYNLE